MLRRLSACPARSPSFWRTGQRLPVGVQGLRRLAGKSVHAAHVLQRLPLAGAVAQRSQKRQRLLVIVQRAGVLALLLVESGQAAQCLDLPGAIADGLPHVQRLLIEVGRRLKQAGIGSQVSDSIQDRRPCALVTQANIKCQRLSVFFQARSRRQHSCAKPQRWQKEHQPGP